MTRVYWIIGLLLVALAAGAALWLSPSLPERIPTHWNIQGKVDGYGGKWTLFMFPVIMVMMLVLFYFLPAISPKPFEVDSFQPTYLYIMDLVLGLFGYMQGVLLYVVHQAATGGPPIDLGRAFVAGSFLFFGLMGNVMGKIRKNFYIGVRVPWTIASDRVWNDTHRVTAYAWVALGVFGFAWTVLGAPMVATIVFIVAAGVIPVIYSFVHYKSLERRGAL